MTSFTVYRMIWGSKFGHSLFAFYGFVISFFICFTVLKSIECLRRRIEKHTWIRVTCHCLRDVKTDMISLKSNGNSKKGDISCNTETSEQKQWATYFSSNVSVSCFDVLAGKIRVSTEHTSRLSRPIGMQMLIRIG